MANVGIKISLDTGDLVSGAENGRRAIEGLIEAEKKANKEGRREDYERLRSDRARIQDKTSGLEKDIKAVASDPRFQAASPNGGTVLKLDPEYVNAVKGHAESIKKYTDDLQGALGSGDTGKVRELTLQIEKQQYETQKTLKDIINTNGDFSKSRLPAAHNPPDREKPRIPSLPENKDWRELKGLSGAITREHGAGNLGDVARLGNARDTLRGVIGQYDRDGKLEAKVKADPEFASQLKEIRDALKGTIVAMDEAAAARDYEKVDQLTGQARQLQGVSHKIIGDNLPSMETKAASNALLHAMSIHQITGAVNTGIQTYVAQLDRSGIVNAQGSGDVMGAKIEELRREGAKESGIGESVGGIAGGLGGGLLSLLIGAPQLAPLFVSGGATLGNFVGGLFGMDENIEANKMATDEAYAKLWERQAPSAMRLTGMLGGYGGTPEENSLSIRRTFENAAKTAAGYGFSQEEGVEQVKQAAQQGLDERQALDAARDVFAFERRTGADRGVLAEFRNRTERFGIADGLNTAGQGRQASGMAPGQFNEFLRSMQRTFEDGISKGFVRGAGEIAGNLSFLSDLNGGSELWKGEQGANRLAAMNAGVTATTGLSSVSDILSFRGAQSLLKQWDAEGNAKERWKLYGDLDPKKKPDGSNPLELRRGYDYIDAMAILERGLTPELFHAQMQMIGEVEDDRTGRVERMKDIYGLNYTGSAALYQAYEDTKAGIREKGKDEGWDETKIAEEIAREFSGEKWKQTIESFQNNDEFRSKELEQLTVIKSIERYITQTGQQYFDNRMTQLSTELVEAWREARDAGKTGDITPWGLPPPPPPLPDKSEEKEEGKTIASLVKDTDTALNKFTEVATAPPTPGESTGDNFRTAQNNANRAEVAEGKLLAEIRKKANSVKYLFNEGWFGFGGDKQERLEMNVIRETINHALDSKDPAQLNAAEEAANILYRYGKDDKTGKPYDEANTFNDLAKFINDMPGMLNALKSLVDKINDAEVNVFTEG